MTRHRAEPPSALAPLAPAEVDAGRLLRIDVDAEVRKIGESRLQGAWQIPAELVRLLSRAGARSVDVRVFARGFEVVGPGAQVDASLLDALSVLADRSAEGQARHRALVRLEAGGALSLLAALALEPRSLDLASVGSGSLSLERGRAPRRDGAGGGSGTRIRLTGVRVDRRVTRRWTRSMCRFLPVPVTVDGRVLEPALGGTIAEAQLASVPRMRVGLTMASDVGRVRLLQDGVVSAHVTLGWPTWLAAAVELGAGLPPEAPPSQLRARLDEHLDRLVDVGVQLLAQQVRAFAEHPPLVQAKLRRYLLEAASRGLRYGELAALPVFPVLTAHGTVRVRWSLDDLLEHAERAEDGRLAALAPDQPPSAFVLPEGPVCVVDETERALLAAHLAARFTTPAPRGSAAPLRATARRLGRALSVWAWGLAGPGAQAPLPEPALSGQERRFLSEIRALLSGAAGPFERVDLQSGAGPVRRAPGRRPRLLLPRDNPLVAAAVRSVAADPDWAWPALVALLEGEGQPPLAARRRWWARGAQRRLDIGTEPA